MKNNGLFATLLYHYWKILQNC